MPSVWVTNSKLSRGKINISQRNSIIFQLSRKQRTVIRITQPPPKESAWNALCNNFSKPGLDNYLVKRSKPPLFRALARSSKLDALALALNQKNRALARARAHQFVKRSKISSFLGQNFLFSIFQFKRSKLKGFQPFFDNTNNQDFFKLQTLKIIFFSYENWQNLDIGGRRK